MTLSARGRGLFAWAVEPIGRGLARIGLTANGITTLGLLFTAAAAVLVVVDRLFVAGWVLLIGGLADVFDGTVARARGSTSPGGGFFDSVADRISDGIIFAALVWYVRDDPVLFAVAAVGLLGAQLTSYVRAKAESLGQECSVGIVERPERAIAIMAALVFHWVLLEPVLWLLAVGGVVTVVQRIVHVIRELDRTTREGRRDPLLATPRPEERG